jgi:hypothetical protein
MMEHRAVVEKLVREQRLIAASMLLGTDPDLKEVLSGVVMRNTVRWLDVSQEVHHIDFKRDHNCPSNLLVLSADIHHGFSPNRRQPRSKIGTWVKKRK